MTAVAVVVAGGIGAGVRFLAGSAIQERLRTELPWGTAVVNTFGAFALGVVAGTGFDGLATDAVVGLLAGFTTYSTWMIECVHLWLEGGDGRRRSVVNLVGLLAAGVVAVALGHLLGSVL